MYAQISVSNMKFLIIYIYKYIKLNTNTNISYCNKISHITGMFQLSKRVIKPGAKEGKDNYWNGEDTMKQAAVHLGELPLNVQTVDVYDNSTGHGCMPADGLDIAKINRGVGYARKKPLNIRKGFYKNEAGEKVQQSMVFEESDVLLVDVCQRRCKVGDGKNN
jgi:hypothetical protein